MSRRGAALGVAAAFVFAGVIHLAYPASTGDLAPRTPVVAMGRLAPGSNAGVASTNATAAVPGTLLSVTTHVLYLNNTDPTASAAARLLLRSSSGVGNVVALEIGIDVGGTRTPQVVGTLGAITQTTGVAVTLPAASTNRIYVTRVVAVPLQPSQFVLDVVTADTAAETATVLMRAVVSLS